MFVSNLLNLKKKKIKMLNVTYSISVGNQLAPSGANIYRRIYKWIVGFVGKIGCQHFFKKKFLRTGNSSKIPTDLYH